jgi:hypothetical protein
MKKIIVFALLLIVSATSFSQPVTNTAPTVKTDYLQKSRKQKTAAWVMLGGGLILSTTSLAISIGKAGEDIATGFAGILTLNPDLATQNDYTGETILLIAGTAAIISSIPLFIASRKNKRKGMSLSFKNETTQQVQKGSFVYSAVPSLTLKISL